MKTEILTNATEQIHEKVEQEKAHDAPKFGTGGLLQTGENINGYVIQSLEKSGGEAEIYSCKKGGTTFVLKFYYAHNPDMEILEKVRNIGNDHPHILSDIEYGQYKGRHFSIYEYAKGGALDEKTTTGKYKHLPITEAAAEEVLKGTLSAFNVCHKNGVIHRDIKPGNLFYKNADGTGILIGDFGIASVFEADAGMSKHLTKTGAHTAGYAAPELYSGVIGKELDYYALGITMWTLLTGKEPFVNEKGEPLYDGQIALDTIQGKMADRLISRKPKLGERMQKLIRGLLTVRHEKRWGHSEVTRFLAGEEPEIFAEAVRDLPPLEIAGTRCYSYKEIAEAMLANPEEGQKLLFKGKLAVYLMKTDQKLADKILDLSDEYSADNRLDEGLCFVAYTLCPNLPFAIGENEKIASFQDMLSMLETNPQSLIPFLRNEKLGLYTYLKAVGLGEIGEKAREVVNSCMDDFKMIPRITVALKGNAIKPFQDGINNDLELREIEQLYNLPEYLQERTLLFIERKSGDLPAWIESITGRNLELWLCKDDDQKGNLLYWGKWKYFMLFLQGNDIQCGEDFKDEESENYGYRDYFGKILLPPIWDYVNSWSITNKFIVQKNDKWGIVKADGSTILSFEYDNIDEYEIIEVFDEERHLYKVPLCHDEDTDKLYEDKIINEEGLVVYSGKMKIYDIPIIGNRFEVIYAFDGSITLLSKDFKPIRKLNGKSGFTYKKSSKGLYNTHVYIWCKENKKTFIYNGKGITIAELPYSDFDIEYEYKYEYVFVIVTQNNLKGISDAEGNLIVPVSYDHIEKVSDNIFFVLKNKKWGIINALGNRTVIPCEYNTAQGGSSYFAMGKGNDYFVFTTKEQKQVCRITKQVSSYIIYDNTGKKIKEVVYIRSFFKKLDKNGYSDDSVYELYCFDGIDFLCIDLSTLKVSKRDPSSYDGEYLLEHFDGNQIWQMINNLKKQGNTKARNDLVNATWRHFFDNKDWEMARRILFFIKPDNMEGLSSDYDHYLAYIARTLQEQENYEGAVQYYEDAIKQAKGGMGKNKNWYYWYCGDCYERLKKYEKALFHFEKSLEFEPDDCWHLYRKGNALYWLDREKEAITCYTMAIEIEEISFFYELRGYAYKKLGMHEKADADYEKAKRLEK